jgi:large subunit ribosomal protein L19
MSDLMCELRKEIYARQNAIKPNFRAGDTVIVYVPMISKGKTIEKPFEGVCIRVTASSFCVRKTCSEDAAEINFSLLTPTRVEVIKYGKVRRARIYYWRDMRGKSARIKTDFDRNRKDKNANN